MYVFIYKIFFIFNIIYILDFPFPYSFPSPYSLAYLHKDTSFDMVDIEVVICYIHTSYCGYYTLAFELVFEHS